MSKRNIFKADGLVVSVFHHLEGVEIYIDADDGRSDDKWPDWESGLTILVKRPITHNIQRIANALRECATYIENESKNVL